MTVQPAHELLRSGKPRSPRRLGGGVVDELLASVDRLQRELQAAHEALAGRDRAAQALLEVGDEARVLTDSAGLVVTASASAGSLFGMDTQAMRGHNLWRLLGEEASWQPVAEGLRSKGLAMLHGAAGARPVLVESAGRRSGPGGLACWVLTDFTRPLLPGEDMQVNTAGLARTWLRAYSELIGAHEALAGDGDRSREADLGGSSTLEVDRINLDFQLARLVYRRNVWRQVHARLTGLTVDRAASVLRNRQHETAISRREAQLLMFLLDHPSVTFTAEALISRAWRSGYLSTEQLRTYIVRCRNRLAEVDGGCDIVNVRARGYRLDFADA